MESSLADAAGYFCRSCLHCCLAAETSLPPDELAGGVLEVVARVSTVDSSEPNSIQRLLHDTGQKVAWLD